MTRDRLRLPPMCPECGHNMFDEFWCGECDFGPGIYMCDKAIRRQGAIWRKEYGEPKLEL